MVSGLVLARRSSWTADQTRVRGRRMPSSSMEWPNPGGGLLMGGGVRAGVGLLHACLSACWPTALVLPLCPLPLPCVSSGLLVLPVAVCTACSCQHWLLVKLGACNSAGATSAPGAVCSCGRPWGRAGRCARRAHAHGLSSSVAGQVACSCGPATGGCLASGVARELYRKVQRADGGRSGPVLA